MVKHGLETCLSFVPCPPRGLGPTESLLGRPILLRQALALRYMLITRTIYAFEWILVNDCRINRVLHYLDDFFFVEPDNSTCHASMTRVKDKVHQLGVLMEPSKETGLITTITFLRH